MKPSDTNLAKFYNLTRQTIANYRNDALKLNLYFAMVEYYLKQHTHGGDCQ